MLSLCLNESLIDLSICKQLLNEIQICFITIGYTAIRSDNKFMG